MTSAPIAQNEPDRLKALYRYSILDTLPTEEFDDFTKLASKICNTPIALISLVDANRQWFKSNVGLNARQTPRDISFCGHAIHKTDLFEIPDALEDERFSDNPLVTGAPHIRFYAGQPLVTSEGYCIGTLCVISPEPHQLNLTQRNSMRVLGRLLMQQLDLHLALDSEKNLNKELTKQAAFRNTLHNSAGISIISCDARGIVTSFNPSAEQLLGYTAHEIIGKVLLSSFHSRKRSGTSDEDSLNFLRLGGSHCKRESVYFRKDDTAIPVEVTTTPIIDEEKSLIGYLELALDISERKVIENTKSEFISAVSHELRTPLTSIHASLSLLQSGVAGNVPPAMLDLIAVANRNSQRLITLVNDILDMDKLMSGKIIFRTDQINLVQIVKQSLEINASYATAFKTQYKIMNAPPESWVIGDADRIMQVMANLMSNAAKFSPENGQIEISVFDEEESFRVEVRDYGDGIPVEFQSQVFNKFSQAASGNTRHQGGTGLGLNICRQLIEKMNGKIGFSTEKGQGTRFWFTLPAYRKK